MRPASTSNLSFHSSSDGTETAQAAYERLGTDSTGLASWHDGSSLGQGFATARSADDPNTGRSYNATTLREDAFATARSAAAPTTGRSHASSAAAAATGPPPRRQSPVSYPTEDKPLRNEDSPQPPSARPGAAARPIRRLPISHSMGTLPPDMDDRPSPSEGRTTGTVTPVASPPLTSAGASHPLVPPLRLPRSAPRPVMPPLDVPASSFGTSSSSLSELSSGDLAGRQPVSSPLVLASSPLAGKPAARQVSFSQPRSADKPRLASTSSLPASPNVVRVPTFAGSSSGSLDARRNSGSLTAGPSSPPRRRASLQSSDIHIPTRRYTISPADDAFAATDAARATGPPPPPPAPPTVPPPTVPAPASTEKAGGGGGLWSWYEAAKRGVYGRTDRINTYLDGLIDPIGGGAAANDASPAAVARGLDDDDDDRAVSPLAVVRADDGEPSVLDAIEGVPPPRRRGLLYSSDEDHHPFGASRQKGGAARRLVEQVFLEGAHEPITTQGRMAHLVEIDSADLDDGDMTDVDAEQPTFEIDLISAFHGYRSNPNECFGHLVAAALTSRSEERPVTGLEIREAGRNPYLVRLVLSYSWLDFEDPVAREEVQATLDLMVNEHDPDISPALYEYLVVFFQVPFIRLSHRQYTILKQSGFEYVVLLYHHRHVLPPVRFHSILFNYSRAMRVCNLVVMLISSASMILQNVAMLLVLANWMTEEDKGHQRFGFFTLIVYGCGYAVNLVMLIFFMRTRQDTFLFDESAGTTGRSDMPSPYVLVVPVLPIFDLLCVVQYARAWRNDRLVAMHNVLVSSRLSGVCFSIVFSMAQFIAQSYFYHTLQSPEFKLKSDWHYSLLAVASTAQWGITLLRFGWMMLTYDSITGVGFTRFNIPYQNSILERHSAVVHILHYLMIFVVENNIYLLVASALTRADYPDCAFLPDVVLALASVSILYSLILYGILIFSSVSAAKVSFTCIPLALIQVAQFVVTIIRYNTQCTAYERRVMRAGFIFGYIHWCGYIFAFISWLLWLIWWIAYRHCNTNLFPRLNGPWKRDAHSKSDDVKPVDVVQSVDGSGGGGEAAPSAATSS